MKHFQSDNFLDYKKAISIFHESLTLDADQAQKSLSYLFLSYCFVWDVTAQNQKEHENLFEILKRIIASQNDFEEFYITQVAFEVEVISNLANAEKLIKKGLEKYPKNPWLFYYLGKVKSMENDKEGALGAYEKSIQADSSFIRSYYEKAQVLLSQGKLQEGQEAYQVGLDVFPSHKATQLELAVLTYALENQSGIALDHLKKLAAADELFPKQKASAHYYMGKIYQDIGSLDLSYQHFEKAMNLDLENENYSEAYKVLTSGGTIKLSSTTQKNAQFFINVGLLNLKNKQYFTAAEKFEIATKLDPKNAEAWFYLGECYVSMGLYKAYFAMEVYEKAIALKADYTQAYLKLAELYLKFFHFKKARTILIKLEQLSPDEIGFHYWSGVYFSKMELLDQAIAALEKVAAKNLGFEQAIAELSKVYLVKKSYGPALALLDRALNADSLNIEAYLLRIQVLVSQGFPNQAKQYLEKASKKAGSKLFESAGLCQLYFSMSQWDLSVQYAQKALAQNPKLFPVQNILADALIQKGAAIAAAQVYHIQKGLDPVNAEIYFKRAQILIEKNNEDFNSSACGLLKNHFEMNKIPYPQEQFNQLYELCKNRRDTESFHQLSQIYQDAEKDLNSIVGTSTRPGLSPFYPRAHFYLGQIYEAYGNTSAAIKAYKEEIQVRNVTENRVDTAVISMRMGDIYYRSNRYEEAIPYYKDALSKRADLTDAALKIGISYFKSSQMRDLDIALSYLQGITKQDPENSSAHYFLAEVYKAMELKDKAIESYKEYLKNDPNSPIRSEVISEIESLEKF
ncbi:MAG: tetratricopeptide repeat protein [Deltaproteobacteria bacterium]|nr:tetratricopeptide repeat protein [Deltaproteobacteria bacterium]